MRCVAFCTANSYKLAAIADFFKAKHAVVKFYRDVLHVSKTLHGYDIFLFKHGCFVTWGMRKYQEQKILQQLKDFAFDPLEKIEISHYIYKLGAETKITAHPRFRADIISISNEEAYNIPLKLAISYSLAQSVKLESYEDAIQKTIDNNNHIPIELARGGKILLSRKAISKRIGDIFLVRSSVNLNSEYLEVPEYFWQYSNLESYYIAIEQFLDVPKRVATLNRKLDVLNEIFVMLNNQLQHRYSSILEAIIILLIFIEILISLLDRF